MPPLIYAWHIDRIERQAAPFVEIAPRYFERDPAQLAWAEIEATNAWEDDGGYASYLLHCTLVDEPPRRRSATAL